MRPYAKQTTAELIDLLFKKDDRVTQEHIEELARRGEEAIGPLREILRNEKYWMEGERGEFWIVLHAVAILGAMHEAETLPELIAAILRAYHSDNNWVYEMLPAALEQCGKPAIEPLMQFIREHRDDYLEDHDYSYARGVAATGLARIALEHPTEKARITDFLCGHLTDPLEDDHVFLTFMASDVVALDRERGLDALRLAYEREAIDERIYGDYAEFIEDFEENAYTLSNELTRALLEFYQPEEIAARQERWRRENETGTRMIGAGAGPGLLLREPGRAKIRGWLDNEMAHLMTTRYKITDDGDMVPDDYVGRNDPCPCGSGKKFKKCCG